jgi:hypothetical protein
MWAGLGIFEQFSWKYMWNYMFSTPITCSHIYVKCILKFKLKKSSLLCISFIVIKRNK